MRRHHYHAPHAMRLGLCGRLWRLGGFRYVLYTPFCGAQRPASPWPFREVRTSRSYSRRAGATRSPLPASWNKCNPAGRNDGWAGVPHSEWMDLSPFLILVPPVAPDSGACSVPKLRVSGSQFAERLRVSANCDLVAYLSDLAPGSVLSRNHSTVTCFSAHLAACESNKLWSLVVYTKVNTLCIK